jgi:hypothetical protein
MDPISIASLAVGAWKLIEPYAKKLGGKLVEKAGESLPDVVGKVWDSVKEKMETKPETQSLPSDLVKAPEDEDTQGAFKYQLKKLLENDDAFAKRLEDLVKEAKQVTSYSANLEGDGAIAQGTGAVAVGKGGVHVGGNVNGSNIVTGNDNRINTEKRKKTK